MRADFFRPEDPETVVGTGRWNGRSAEVSSADDDVRGLLVRLFRATPVVVDEPSLRPPGSAGDVIVQPGSLEWFRLAALGRAGAAGLRVRLVPEVTSKSGWDPASAYRTFSQVMTLLESPATPVDEPVPEAAKTI